MGKNNQSKQIINLASPAPKQDGADLVENKKNENGLLDLSSLSKSLNKWNKNTELNSNITDKKQVKNEAPLLNIPEINIKWPNNLKPESSLQVGKSESIMLQANADDDNKADVNEMHLENMNIENLQATKSKNIKLGDSGIGIEMYGRRFELSYWKIFVVSFLVMVVSGVATGIMFLYSKYTKFAVEPILYPPYDEWMDKYQWYLDKIDNIVPITKYLKYKDLTFDGLDGKKNLEMILHSKELPYIQKKRLIQNQIELVSTNILSEFQQLSQLRQNITQYGLISQEVYTLLQKQKQVVAIRKSLLSLEVVKFSSAMRVFSYLDTFLDGLVTAMPGMQSSQAGNLMQKLVTRGEKDIYTYLNNCYLNPFEWDYDCSRIWDFDNYYSVVEPQVDIDTNFFKQLIKYIDIKLEQTEIPSFSIVFKKFDPTQKEISFVIDVNTFQKDEIALAEKNIINPHIFVVTELLNLLKQSKFIIWKSIDIRELRVEPQIIRIGDQQFSINNSSMNLTLPIQKTTEREIYDFVDGLNEYKNIKYTDNIQETIGEEKKLDNDSNPTKIANTGDIESPASINSWLKMDITGSDFAYQSAKTFLTITRDQTAVQYQIQEIGEAKVVAEWADAFRVIIKEDEATAAQIKQAIEIIAENSYLRGQISEPRHLLQINEQNQRLIDVIISNQSTEDTNKENIWWTETVQWSGFWQLRWFFEKNPEQKNKKSTVIVQ